MNQREIFDSLATNAFDFLHRAIGEFDKAPKYSVIHFCAAVEMLLKARLMMEHWSLVVSKPDQANLQAFKEGNFASVTLEETRTRLKNIAGEDIPDIAFGSFQTLAKHRNKMIHFFHEGLDRDQKALEQIVSEQCRSWLHLHRLLIRWDKFFGDFSRQIAEADRLLKLHRKYLKAKFSALKEEIATKRSEGIKPRSCSACRFKAAIPEPYDEQIANLKCLVCDYEEVQVEIGCPRCHKTIFVNNEMAPCSHGCGQDIDSSVLVEQLANQHDDSWSRKSGDNIWQIVNCGRCYGPETVVRRGDHYFCTECFDWCADAGECEFCNEPCTGDLEDSYLEGCGYCDGRIGWNTDD